MEHASATRHDGAEPPGVASPFSAGVPTLHSRRRALAVLALAAATLPLHAAVEEHSYEVIPSGWITGNGSAPATVAAGAGKAFVFPSTMPGVQAGGKVTFALAGALKKSARFPGPDDSEPFHWSDGGNESITITAVRHEAQSPDLDITVDNIASIQQLSWKSFRRLQQKFDRWLRHRASCFWCEDGSTQFFDLSKTLLEIWTQHVLSEAAFDVFAKNNLNRKEFDISADSFSMHVVPLGAWDQIVIGWGTDVIYPGTAANGSGAPLVGFGNGYSRPSVGGISQLTITASESGLGLFPKSTPTMTAAPIKFPANPAGLYPFPLAWRRLFGTAFVPIYNLLDLHNSSLLSASTSNQSPSIVQALFLLVPATYAKADVAGVGAFLAQYPSDARVSVTPDVGKAELLMGRFGILGTRSCGTVTSSCEDAVKTEFSKLAALADNPNGGSFPDYVAGFFMNQTAVDIAHRVRVNGDPLAEVPDTETWKGVTAQWIRHAALSEPGFDGPPTLRVRRSITGVNGLPALRMTFRFYTIDASVLEAARVGEGDEFDDLSTRLHK